MKQQTGEWFDDLKAKRFLEYPNATDLLQGVLHEEPKSGFLQARRTALTKNKSLTFLEIMFAKSTVLVESAKRCSIDQKNFAIKEGSSSPGADEQLSVTQILKDLEFILDLEMKNSSGNAEIADINGFSPENVMVDKKLPADYSSHQVWHYPGLLNLESFQTTLSPIKNAKLGSGKGLLANKYDYSKDVNIVDVYPCPKQMYQHTENDALPVSPGLLEPLCSSPYLAEPFRFSEDYLGQASKFIDTPYTEGCHLEPKELAELSCETTLETESTIELPTMIPANSLIFMDEHVPLVDTTSPDNGI
ncbi:uncharacterized protein LOC130362263 [Hyla sarda]|uniref:uncharacterized protein LOC130362263 n=1 Tax=Hyla sarda TaxID=327740 RepID=UPI0024C318A3|nr:uncharacterized protein LOC130362263 [Hyla sarda]